MNKKIVGYQITSNDGKNNIPVSFFSWQIFKRKHEAVKWLGEKKEWLILPVQKGAIENYKYIKIKPFKITVTKKRVK